MKKLITFLLIVFINFPFFAQEKADTITIQNKKLSIRVSLKGAEIISIYYKKEKLEHLWQGEKASWNKHAPILFPAVGKIKNGTYSIDGKTYKMKNHGFASSSFFQLISKSDTKVVLQLTSNKETLKIYPYQFKLIVTYLLKGSKLKISHIVENTDNQKIYFSIGAHPGFNVPFYNHEMFDDYYIQFSKKISSDRLLITKKEAMPNGKRQVNFINNTRKLALSHQLFKDKVVILDGVKAHALTIKSNSSKFGIKIGGINKFTYLGLWTSPQKEAPFICIEPWYGISDKFDTDGNFKVKKGIKTLQVGDNFVMKYFIKIVKTN